MMAEVKGRLSLLGVAAMAVACRFDSSSASRPGDGGTTDANGDSGALADGMTAGVPHILLSEVKPTPDDLEFIEIYNPTCYELSLATLYLTDVPSYLLLPSWGDSPPSPGLLNAVVRFPAGEMLAAGAAAVVARDGGAFAAEFGAIPRFALTNIGDSTGMEFVVYQSTQDMTIFNSGEPIVLFEWDGERDLVLDVDIVIAGDAPPEERRLLAKQDLAPDGVDGPDIDTTASSYLEESVTIPTMQDRENAAGSYQRIALEGEFEAAGGGNGVVGHDETSEDTRDTWEQEVASPPTPGSVPLALAPSCP